MGHKNKESLTKQVQNVLEEKLAIGESKHQAKLEGNAQAGIYSWETFHAYMRHDVYFVEYCKAEHGCKTLQECRQYVDEWLESRSRLSPYTQKLEAAALAKLYGCSSKDFVATSPRHRADITRSRGEKKRDKHFSEERNKDFVDFCKGTGLRRSELECLTGDRLVYIDGKPHIDVLRGSKGGKLRTAPIVGEVDKIVSMMVKSGSGKVFDRIPNGADIHGYRSEYATAVYMAHARSYSECKADHEFWNKEHYNGKGKPRGGYDKDCVYHFQGDRKGDWLDKRAMLKASEALGHNRISIVAGHYIR